MLIEAQIRCNQSTYPGGVLATFHVEPMQPSWWNQGNNNRQRAKQNSLLIPHQLMHVIKQQSLATFHVPAAAERCNLLLLG